jgi:hypothetical protein
MTVTGTISGTVLDPSGQIVPAANVTLSSEKTGDRRTAAANGSGFFNFVAVPPDMYSLRVETRRLQDVPADRHCLDGKRQVRARERPAATRFSD